MDLQDIFISNLKIIRKGKRITQEKFAELCDTDTSYIGQIETRKRFPSVSFIEKIAVALGVEPYQLFKDEFAESEEQRARIIELKRELFDLIDEDVGVFLKKHCL